MGCLLISYIDYLRTFPKTNKATVCGSPHPNLLNDVIDYEIDILNSFPDIMENTAEWFSANQRKCRLKFKEKPLCRLNRRLFIKH